MTMGTAAKALALVIARICAEHPLAVQFNNELAIMAEKRKLIVERLISESREMVKSAHREYSYEVKSSIGEAYLPLEIREKGAFRVVRRWLNKAEFLALSKTYGVSCKTDDPDTVCSVVYYRLGGVLVAAPGTGSALLKINQECSEHEWSLIQMGMVPGKFINR